MTHSNEDKEISLDANMDAFDVDDIDGINTTDEDRVATRDALDRDTKTDKEIQIDNLEQLLSYSKINSWERGFCTSCLTWLKSKPDAQLSYKQKDVLGKTVAKHFD